MEPTWGFYGPRDARVVLVGEAPSRTQDERGTFDAALIRQDLAELAGVGYPGEWKAIFGRVNLLKRWPGSAGKGSDFPAAPARAAAAELRPKLVDVPRVVLLGRRVALAFGIPTTADWFTWQGNLAVSPHPSKVSLWWNSPENVARARTFWAEVARSARGAGAAAPRR